jgi:hypothetical protein
MTSYNDQYYVVSNQGDKGPYNPAFKTVAMKRHPTFEERNILCDIGYKVKTEYGVGMPSTAPGPYFNYYDYTGSTCGESVAGINDGIDLSWGTYLYVTSLGA